MRDRERPNVEIAESSSKSSYIDSAVVMCATTSILLLVQAKFFVFLSQLARATPFCARQNEILP